jgi:hypothetical protein
MDESRSTGSIAVTRAVALLAVVALAVLGAELFVRGDLPDAAFDTAVAVLLTLLLIAVYNSVSGYRTRPG